MPVDYANGPLPAPGFPVVAKSQNPFFFLKSGLVDLPPHITGARSEAGKDLSFPFNKELWKTPICCVLTKTSCVCGTACQLSPLPAHAQRAGSAERGVFQPTHWPYITRRVVKPTCSFGGEPRTANICCGSRRTRGLQTAHLHFWERPSSHERFEG